MRPYKILSNVETISIIKKLETLDELKITDLKFAVQKQFNPTDNHHVLIRTIEGFLSVTENKTMTTITEYANDSLQSILNEKEKELESLESLFGLTREVTELAPELMYRVKRRLKVSPSEFRVVNVVNKKDGRISESLLMLKDYDNATIQSGFIASSKKAVEHGVELSSHNIVDFLPFDFEMLENVTVVV